MNYIPYITGLTVGLSLITVIGSQNIYIIRQGILREYVFRCAFVCALCDVILIALSVLCSQVIGTQIPILKIILTIGGFLFLISYGSLYIYNGIYGKNAKSLDKDNTTSKNNVTKTLLIAVSFSLLNPHAIMDTFVIMGGITTAYSPAFRDEFALGAITASILWFFVLSTVAFYFSKLLRKKAVWQCLEILSGSFMIFIAIKLTSQI